nr:putative ribonuclease H-like domain-containing protein [Tanacetum cinerariifolium]
KAEEAADVDIHLYRSMIGSLMYLTASRLDIMFAFCACSRFQVTPKTSYLQAVKRIFRYLKGQPKLGLWYPNVSTFDLEAYSDGDYAGENLDRKSITGGVNTPRCDDDNLELKELMVFFVPICVEKDGVGVNAVCACSRFQVTPNTSHLQAVKRIFRYLKGQPKLCLWYPKVSSFDLEAYSDNDYAGANLDMKSTTGEAEYVAAAHCCGQVL